MADREHLAILKQGVQVWNRWRKESPHTIPFLQEASLPGINLEKADLTNVDFEYADLQGACFAAARLYQAEFFRADLREADFRRADLAGAKFHAADLRFANLEGSDLYRVDFIGTLLAGANMAKARCMTTAFSDVDLSSVIGLSEVKHSGPSNIDISTLLKSQGQLPWDFVRGAGLPDHVLDYVRALAEPAIQFFSIFLSYSTKDEDFASRLYEDLRAAGVRCWFASHDIQGGKKIHDQIDQAIRLYDRLLLILSDHSMNSEWVKTEISHARERETRENRQMLFPVSLVPYDKIKTWRAFDADTGKDSAREIREYFIPDFSSWKDQESYGIAFQRLLKDLEASQVPSKSGTP